MKKLLKLAAISAAITIGTISSRAEIVNKEINLSKDSTTVSSSKTTTKFKYGVEGVSLQMSNDKGVDFDFLAGFHFGWGVLPTKAVPEYENNIWKSFIFEWSIAQLNVRLNPAGTLYATGALNMSWSNIVWEDSNKRLLDSPTNAKQPYFDYSVGLGEKSKIRVDYLGLPIGVKYEKGDLTVYGNISAEVLTTAKTKFKSEEGKDLKTDLRCANRFRSRIEAGVAYNSFGLYVSYCLTPMFREGPKINPVNFGIVWLWD